MFVYIETRTQQRGMSLEMESTARTANRARTHAPFATRRRLVLAFGLAFAAFLAVLAVEGVAIRRMETAFHRVERAERALSIALQLDLVRDQFEEASAPGIEERGQLDAFRHARDEAVELGKELASKVESELTGRHAVELRAALDKLYLAIREVEAREVSFVEPDSYPRDGRAVMMQLEKAADGISRLLQLDTVEAHRELGALQSSAFRWSFVLLLVTAAFLASAAVYLSRSVARPLARLSEGAARFKAGDLDHRIDLRMPDEFGLVASEFDDMAAALKQHQRALVDAEKLAAVGRLAAGIAHEINNPVQAILGYLSLDRDVRDARLRGHIEAMEQEARYCQAIVADLLQLARPEPDPGRGLVDLRRLCEDVATTLTAAGGEGAGRIAVEGAGSALADAGRIRQVIFNLVKNATEASGAGGRVDVRIAQSEAAVMVAVTDSGSGIRPEDRARLFEPFFTTKPRGTGLGLAVSRAIARAHGGDVDLGAAGPPGATFALRLPRATEGTT